MKRFVVMEVCSESYRCERINNPYILEAASLEEAEAKILAERSEHLTLTGAEKFKAHRITIHQISRTETIDFSTFIDSWLEKTREKVRLAEEEKERQEYERLRQKFEPKGRAAPSLGLGVFD